MRNGSKEWIWTPDREQAAVLVADDTLQELEIATQIGIDRWQLRDWERHPAFAARVAEHVDALRAKLAKLGLTARENRIKAKSRRHERIEQVFEARSLAYPDELNAPGASSGILEPVPTRSGTRWQPDATLLRESRELETEIAKELGEWVPDSQPGGNQVHITFKMLQQAQPAVVDADSWAVIDDDAVESRLQAQFPSPPAPPDPS